MNKKMTEKKSVSMFSPISCVIYSLIAVVIMKFLSGFLDENSYLSSVTAIGSLWDVWNSVFLIIAGIFTAISFLGRVITDSSIIVALPLIGMFFCLIKKQKEINKLFEERKEAYSKIYGSSLFDSEIEETRNLYTGDESVKDFVVISSAVIFALVSLFVTLSYPNAFLSLLKWISSYADGSVGGISEWVSSAIIEINNSIITMIKTDSTTTESYSLDNRDYCGIAFIYLLAFLSVSLHGMMKKNKAIKKMNDWIEYSKESQ